MEQSSKLSKSSKCGKIIQWPKHTQTQYADCSQFQRDIRWRHPRNDLYIINCIAWTTDCDNSNDTLMPYGFGRQLPIIPPNLNDLSLPPNPFNILATMAIANNTEDANDNNYSPESPEPSKLSQISTPPMNVSAFNSWETSYTTTNDDTFYSSDEPRIIYFLPPTPSPPPSPSRKMKRRLSLGMSLQKMGECRSASAKPAVRRSQK